ncbi:hypothetical protein EDD15DRAFT_2515914 [Pisolithus albus]|nr:hypothetical protein EDD15DRAFT_2515914 [Pisolithus albus]
MYAGGLDCTRAPVNPGGVTHSHLFEEYLKKHPRGITQLCEKAESVPNTYLQEVLEYNNVRLIPRTYGHDSYARKKTTVQRGFLNTYCWTNLDYDMGHVLATRGGGTLHQSLTTAMLYSTCHNFVSHHRSRRKNPPPIRRNVVTRNPDTNARLGDLPVLISPPHAIIRNPTGGYGSELSSWLYSQLECLPSNRMRGGPSGNEIKTNTAFTGRALECIWSLVPVGFTFAEGERDTPFTAYTPPP